MKIQYILILLVSILISCATFEKDYLYGHWKSTNWEFVFNEDGSCKVGKNGQFSAGDWSYHTFGNAIEIVRNGEVFLSNLTIKKLVPDTLTLEFRNLQDEQFSQGEIMVRQR